MPALVSYWEGAILHFPLNQYTITRQVKGYPFEVQIHSGLEVSGVILADQVKSLDWRAREAELAGRLPAAAVAEVLQKLNTLLGGQVS